MKKFIFSFLCICSFYPSVFAQQDTLLIDRLTQLCSQKELSNFDSALYYGNKALSLSEKINDNKRKAIVLRRIGNAYLNKGKAHKSLGYQKASLEISRKISYKAGIAAASSNIGNCFYFMGRYNEALDHYRMAMLLFSEIGDLAGHARTVGNIGLIYLDLKEYKKSLEYQLKSFSIRLKLKDTIGLALATGNISALYHNLHKLDSGYYYVKQAVMYNKAINSRQGLCTLYGNYADMLMEDGKTAEAEKYFKLSYAMSDTLGDYSNKGHNAINLARMYTDKKMFNEAISMTDTAVSLGKQINELSMLSQAYLTRYRIMKALNDPAEALRYQELYMNTKDSLFNDEKKADLARQEVRSQYEQQKQLEKIENEKKDLETRENLKRQRLIQYLLLTVVGAILVIVFFVYKSYRQKNRDNILLEKKNGEISRQKQLVEEKQKEILDSIHYAERIQKALMMPEKQIAKILTKINKD